MYPHRNLCAANYKPNWGLVGSLYNSYIYIIRVTTAMEEALVYALRKVGIKKL